MTTAASLDAAQRLAADLPRLLLAAERLAFLAAAGLHGRRRAGEGDSFWQFRDWGDGDDRRRIDWRRSAMGPRLFIRQQERQAQASFALRLHHTPGLAFASHRDLPTKRDRAILLLLALAALLLRAGERVALAGITGPLIGPSALRRLAGSLIQTGLADEAGAVSARARRIEFGDFLAPDPHFAPPAGGAVIQILDPAEADFPYTGRIIFEDLADAPSVESPNAATWRATYIARLAAQRAAVARAALAAGQTPLFHRTDAPPGTALAALYQALQNR